MPRRGKNGRFVKGGGRGRASTAIVPYRAAPIVVQQSRSPVRRAAGVVVQRIIQRRSGGGGGGSHVGERVRKGVAVTGFVLGWLSKNQAATIEKVPALGGSRMLTIALGLHMLAKNRPGGYVDHAATAATAIAAFNFGEHGLSGLSVAGVAGDDDPRAHAGRNW